jgi:hypothetical protein
MQGFHGNFKFHKDQSHKRLVLFRSTDEFQEANLFQVCKLRMEAEFETHTSGLGGSK